jgi:uncharacterized small protein (DUF1192 family)
MSVATQRRAWLEGKIQRLEEQLANPVQRADYAGKGAVSLRSVEEMKRQLEGLQSELRRLDGGTPLRRYRLMVDKGI